MSDRWIVVPNWDKFQHYHDREPVWIKLYLELNSRDEWRQLTFGQRGLLVSVWIEYARSDFRLRVADVWGRVGQPDRHGNLEALTRAGFLEVSASPRARRERRDREETPKPPSEKGADSSNKKQRRRAGVTGWREVRGSHGIDYVPDPNGHAKPPYSVPAP